MSGHFEDLGKKSEEEKRKGTPPVQGPDLGPLAEAALKRQKEREAKGQVGWDESGASQADVDRIVADDDIRSILMDPEMQRVLQEVRGDPDLCGVQSFVSLHKTLFVSNWGREGREMNTRQHHSKMQLRVGGRLGAVPTLFLDDDLCQEISH